VNVILYVEVDENICWVACYLIVLVLIWGKT